MSPFYKPISLTIKDLPVLIYPMVGLEKVLSNSNGQSIGTHITKLYEQNNTLINGDFHIIILWSDNDKIMTDVWQYLQLESEEAGYTIDCKTFSNYEVITGNGLTASDGLIMLGRETEKEEEMRKNGKEVKDFIFGERPELPGDLNPSQEFR